MWFPRQDLRKKFRVGDILAAKGIPEIARCKVIEVRRSVLRVKAIGSKAQRSHPLGFEKYYTIGNYAVENWELAMNGIERARALIKREKS